MTAAPPLRQILRERPRFFVAIFLAFWVSYLVHFNPAATGSDRFVLLALSLVDQHTLRIDAYKDATNELASTGGHYYLNTNPGMSYLALPAVALSRLVPLGTATGPGTLPFFAAHFAGFATTTAVAGALTCVLLAALLLQWTGSSRWALLAAAVYGFGSISFFFSTRLQQNVVIAFFALLVWAMLRERPEEPGRGTLLAIGFLLGLGLFIDLSIVPLGLAVLVALLWERRFTALVPLALGAIAPVACLALYQWLAFGDPLAPAQAYIPRQGTVLDHGLLGLTLPSPARLLPQILSLDCGLLVFMPWTVLALLPLRRGAGEPRVLSPREARLVGSMVLFYLLWVSVLPSFRFCLFGPRYLMPFLPPLAGLALLRLSSWPRLGAATLAAGFLVNLAGAQIGIPTDNVIRTVVVWVMRGPWLPVVPWIQTNLPEGPRIVTPYGLLLLWVVALAAIYLWGRAAAREDGRA